MRKHSWLLGSMVFAMAIALSGAPITHADNASFLAQSRALGFQQDDDVLIRMALSACRFLQPNLRRNPIEVEQHITRYAALEPANFPDPRRRPDPPRGDAHKFLILSVNEYCPDLAYRIPG